MSSKPKHSGGPKSNKGKAISSRNSTTHGLTAKRWLDTNEQSLYSETVQNLIVDFEPQTSIEKILISKLAECTVRLMRIQQVENAMFDLASSEADHPEESIKSINNNNEKLIQLVYATPFKAHQSDPCISAKKELILEEIYRQDLSDVSDWFYVNKHMPTIAVFIVKKCINENLSFYDFISQEIDQSSNQIIKIAMVGEDPFDESAEPIFEEFKKNVHKVSASSLQEYLIKLSDGLTKDLQVRFTLKNLEGRIQQMKDAAMPDTQKLSLIQYKVRPNFRTAT